MTTKLYLILSGTIFFLVGILHLLRLVYQWPVVVGTLVVPHELSYFGLPVATGCGLWAVWLLRRR
jgi:hypothetical protein